MLHTFEERRPVHVGWVKIQIQVVAQISSKNASNILL